MKIKLTSIYVDDQQKALDFYTDKLGFAKKADFTNGPYRWLTVTSPDESEHWHRRPGCLMQEHSLPASHVGRFAQR